MKGHAVLGRTKDLARENHWTIAEVVVPYDDGSRQREATLTMTRDDAEVVAVFDLEGSTWQLVSHDGDERALRYQLRRASKR